MQAKLIALDGGRTIHLKRDITLVGRKRGVCDVFLERSSVSKLHCLIVKTDGLLFIRDLGSTNGTKVNGQRVTRGALLPGDELSFANARFRVYLGPSEPQAESQEGTEMMSGPPKSSPSRLDDSEEEDLEADGQVGTGSQSDVQLLSEDSVY